MSFLVNLVSLYLFHGSSHGHCHGHGHGPSHDQSIQESGHQGECKGHNHNHNHNHTDGHNHNHNHTHGHTHTDTQGHTHVHKTNPQQLETEHAHHHQQHSHGDHSQKHTQCQHHGKPHTHTHAPITSNVVPQINTHKDHCQEIHVNCSNHNRQDPINQASLSLNNEITHDNSQEQDANANHWDLNLPSNIQTLKQLRAPESLLNGDSFPTPRSSIVARKGSEFCCKHTHKHTHKTQNLSDHTCKNFKPQHEISVQNECFDHLKQAKLEISASLGEKTNFEICQNKTIHFRDKAPISVKSDSKNVKSVLLSNKANMESERTVKDLASQNTRHAGKKTRLVSDATQHRIQSSFHLGNYYAIYVWGLR